MKRFTIYPAIDILGGKVVRLSQGEYGSEKIYGEDPLAVIHDFAQCGATFIHIVDLDGAKAGALKNFDVIEKMTEAANALGVKTELGGGIRDMEKLRRVLGAGVSRAILGTSAALALDKSKGFVREALEVFGEKIAIGIDAKNGLVRTEGWEKLSEYSGLSMAEEMAAAGAKTIIYTDIKTDGMLSGPNLEEVQSIVGATCGRPQWGDAYALSPAAQVSKGSGGGRVSVISSGGVSSLKDVAAVAETGAAGVIIGKAIYSGNIDLREAISCYQKG
jgi:phosphoribosylformimino-5-aminoimidazole carboxamide ribotide isomerase